MSWNRFADHWQELSQEYFNKALVNFVKRLTAGVTANGGHFEHLQ